MNKHRNRTPRVFLQFRERIQFDKCKEARCNDQCRHNRYRTMIFVYEISINDAIYLDYRRQNSVLMRKKLVCFEENKYHAPWWWIHFSVRYPIMRRFKKNSLSITPFPLRALETSKKKKKNEHAVKFNCDNAPKKKEKCFWIAPSPWRDWGATAVWRPPPPLVACLPRFKRSPPPNPQNTLCRSPWKNQSLKKKFR